MSHCLRHLEFDGFLQADSQLIVLFGFIRMFQLVADIHSGPIFFLLPLNLLFMSFSMYNIENVSIRFSILFQIVWWFSYFFIVSVGRWFWISIFNFLFDMLNELAIFVLLFCYENHWKIVLFGGFCWWFKLVWPAIGTSEVRRFDHHSFARANILFRPRFNLLHIGNSWKSNAFLLIL